MVAKLVVVLVVAVDALVVVEAVKVVVIEIVVKEVQPANRRSEDGILVSNLRKMPVWLCQKYFVL
jgi:hypothetical protein